MKIISSYLINNPCYQANKARVDWRYIEFQEHGPKKLMLHSVGCSQPSASVFIKQWNKTTYTYSCVHAIIDANTGDVYQTLPWNYRGWHGGGSSNNTHVGVEMGESAYIKYIPRSNKFEILDSAKAKADCKRAYDSAVLLFAMLCQKYKLDPEKDICSHKEGYKMGIATDHGDPEHYWRGLSMGYTMDGFRSDVKKCMEGDDEVTIAEAKDMIDAAVNEAVAAKMAEIQNNYSVNNQLLIESLKATINTNFNARLGPQIEEIGDIQSQKVAEVARELLDCEAVDGGTDYEKNPDDIHLPYNILRAVVISKRYTDKAIAKAISKE